MQVLIVLVSVFWIIGVVFQLWGVLGFLRRSSRRTVPRPLTRNFLPVSILKPLKGVDEGLEKNLESFFNLDYPEFELLFAVVDVNDPAVQVVHRLIARYPDILARLIVSRDETIPNPKLSNLLRAYRECRFEQVLISDSNVRVDARYLRSLTQELVDGVGMVSSIVRGEGAEGLAGEIEAVYLNSFYAKGMVLAEQVGETCVVGKAMLFRKSTLERLGGFRALGMYLAEDYMAGIAVKHLGLKIRLSEAPATQHIGPYRFRDFWKRHIRWGRIRKAQAPLTFLVEPLGLPWMTSLFGALFFNPG